MALSFGKKATVALGVAAGISGFSKGLKAANVNQHMYDTLFDDPNYDQEVFGTNVGVRELLAPFPGSFTRMGNIKAGGIRGLGAAVGEGFVNKDFISDYGKYSSYYQNPMPDVNGSLVFGLHNASQGR